MRFEIRVPTFRRPLLLARALRSLICQTHKEWTCRILDDDPLGSSSRSVVEDLNDPRIRLEPNHKNLGISDNISQAFALAPQQGSLFLSVLEDDNYYLPRCLEDTASIFSRESTDIILRNQFAERATSPDGGELFPMDIFTYSGPDANGMLQRSALWATTFHAISASNLSYFWRAGRNISLDTSHFCDEPQLQEKIRALRVDRDVYVARSPLAVWRQNGAESLRVNKFGIVRQAELLIFQTRFYKKLYRYLRERGEEHLIWQPPGIMKLDAQRETFFLVNGLNFRGQSHLSLRERAKIVAKSKILRAIGATLKRPVEFEITDDGMMVKPAIPAPGSWAR